MKVYIIIVLCCAAVSLFNTVKKAGAVSSLFSSAAGGIAGLWVFNMLPGLGILISANLFSVLICAVFGIPGLIGLLFMRMLCVA